MKRVDSEKIVPVVGRFYWVQHVYAHIYKRFMPVFGPDREDAEIINFPEPHWHIDWRFVSDQWIRSKHGQISWKMLGRPLSTKNTTVTAVGKLPWLRRMCRREMPAMKPECVPWLKKLEEAHAQMRLKKDWLCPHRGLPLAGCPVKDGVVSCPGHGLAWNVRTGKLVRQGSEEEVAS